MIAQNQIHKPQNWQDFETLCKFLWGEIWNCTDTIEKNGRSGQKQHGVDVYAYVKAYDGYCGIQCKGKDDYTDNILTENEIDKEISKAMRFEPPLKRFIFATTANKDTNTESYIRKKNIESINNGRFEIYLLSWEDIVDQLLQHKTTYKWYVNNCQFVDDTNISVTFNGKDTTTIHPQYLKTTTKYVLRRHLENNTIYPLSNIFDSSVIKTSQQFREAQTILENIRHTEDILHRRYKHDKRWCTIEFKLVNCGDTVIRNMKMYIGFKDGTIEEISDNFHYLNDWIIDPVITAQINSQRDKDREVFISNEYLDFIEYRSKSTAFIQNDTTNFKISIIPANGITTIPVHWKFLSEDYSKTGELTLIVKPHYEEKLKIVEVDDPKELKDDEVEIMPQIVVE